MWYVQINERRAGPFSDDQLRQLHRDGRLPENTFLWREGWPDWRPAREVFAEIQRSETGEATRKGAPWQAAKSFMKRSWVGCLLGGLALPLLAGMVWLYVNTRWKTAFPFKVVVSTLYLLIAVAGNMHKTTSGLFMFLALCFFWGGDLLTGLMADSYYRYGMVMFMVAYLVLMIAFVVHGVSPKWTVGATAVFAILSLGLYTFVKGSVPSGFEEVTASYFAIMSIFCALSVGQWKAKGSLLALIGCFMILTGDLFLARNLVNKSAMNDGLLLTFHYAGLLILAFSVYERPRGSEA